MDEYIGSLYMNMYTREPTIIIECIIDTRNNLVFKYNNR